MMPLIRDRILLVEGSDDRHVVQQLCKTVGIDAVNIDDSDKPYHFGIKIAEGYDRLTTEGLSSTQIKGSDLKVLGIVVDADASLEDRWLALRNRISEAGYQKLPAEPEPNGTIIAELDKRIGIWVMPDNRISGMLENFVEYMVRPSDVLWPKAQRCVDAIPKEECAFSEIHRIKACIHTWLAWQKEPGKPMSQAISARYLDPSAPQASHFVDWLKRLFQIEQG